MPIKISKVANDLNVGIPTLVEFLQKHNQEVGDPGNLNLRISDEQHEMLVRAFKNDKDLKSKSERYASERQKDKVKNKAPQEPKKAGADKDCCGNRAEAEDSRQNRTRQAQQPCR